MAKNNIPQPSGEAELGGAVPSQVQAGSEPLHAYEPPKVVSWSVIGSLDGETGFERYNSQAALTFETVNLRQRRSPMR